MNRGYEAMWRRGGLLATIIVAMSCCPRHADAQTAPRGERVIPKVGKAGDKAPGSLDPVALRKQQDIQQKARGLTRELVDGILDVQLQQLDENGLSDLPLYKEIAEMKANLSTLVDAEMGDVVNLLARAQSQPAIEQGESYRQARGMIREIVVKLTAERQTLLRRLKAAELIAQTRRVAVRQANVKTATRELVELPAEAQEKRALVAIEDQADVRQLFVSLVDTLGQVSKWDGPVGAGAAEGLRVLSTAGTGTAVDEASSQLEATRYGEATSRQEDVLKGLKLLLDVLERAQGVASTDHQHGLELLRALTEKQQALRDTTRQSDLTQPEPLIDQQAEIRKELGRLEQSLAQALEESPALEQLLEQAQAAAYDATGKLFDQDQDAALDKQGQVLGALAELEQRLQQAATADRSDRSAEQMRKMVSELEALQSALAQAQPEQDLAEAAVAKAEASSDTKPVAEAMTAERGVSQKLEQLPPSKEIPPSVMTRVEQAREAVKTAAEALAKATNTEQIKTAAMSVEDASRTMELARAEVAAALDDGKRQAAAIEIGELARAAEALERAAAAEREVARAATEAAESSRADAAKSSPPTPGRMEALRAEQAEILAVAEKVAEGTATLAESAQANLSKAAEAAREAEKNLAVAREQANSAANNGTPEQREATAKSADAAAAKAAAAARELTAAAKAIREEIGQTADGLIAESDRQLEKVGAARDAVDGTLSKSEPTAAPRLEALSAARQKVAQAEATQQRAAGRPEAARAMELTEAISKAQAMQSAADAAREDLTTGQAVSPAEAAARQQAVADAARDAAKQSMADSGDAKPDGPKPSPKTGYDRATPDANTLAKDLEQAADKSAAAAKAILEGRAKQAETLARESTEALAAARQKASQDAQEKAQAPSGATDAAAQDKVTELARQAESASETALPTAAEQLDQAEAASVKASEAAKRSEADAVKLAQSESAQKLAGAKRSLDDAMERAAEEARKKLGEVAREADPLARKLATVDPGALAASRSAEQAAEEEADSMDSAEAADDTSRPAPRPDEAARAEQAVERQLERAAASLAARQQRVERDKSVAQALKDLSREQQAAVDEIATQRDKLEEFAEAMAEESAAEPATDAAKGDPASNETPEKVDAAEVSTPKKPSKEQISAARQLQSATQKFAQAQRATGQGAEQVSGQSEIANEPLREALDRASGLAPESLPEFDSPAEEAMAQNDPASGQDGAESKSPDSGKAGSKDSAETEAPSGEMADSGAEGGQRALGKEFVPNSPRETARMMAGKQARKAAEAALGQPLAGEGESGRPESGSDEDGQSADQQASSQSDSSTPSESPEGEQSAANPAGQPKDQPGKPGDAEERDPSKSSERPNNPSATGPQKNPGVKDGPLTKTPDSKQPPGSVPGGKSNSNPEARAVREETWHVKLPPELRQALRARGQQRAPKGYEERLERYFKSLD